MRAASSGAVCAERSRGVREVALAPAEVERRSRRRKWSGARVGGSEGTQRGGSTAALTLAEAKGHAGAKMK
ncbi:hypothetical protein GUJ93_ZPchr0009g605 [Zizania palustris]|uniref:Uncharacterized protein n=1 Tax=Zizania palustris TaxID=103762 RepID=A0A8J5RM47_ZIZPA|nr:hypothetical protein GUJ93_ZPchr0009g605 [Zizania palustris]